MDSQLVVFSLKHTEKYKKIRPTQISLYNIGISGDILQRDECPMHPYDKIICSRGTNEQYI